MARCARCGGLLFRDDGPDSACLTCGNRVYALAPEPYVEPKRGPRLPETVHTFRRSCVVCGRNMELPFASERKYCHNTTCRREMKRVRDKRSQDARRARKRAARVGASA